MVRYLSPEWLDELDAAVSTDAGLRAATADVSLVVQQLVTGAAGGDVAYHLVVDHGEVRVRPGGAPHATVSFSQDYGTAAAVASGELSAQGAFMAGRILVRGDLPALAKSQGAFAGIDDVTRSLRTRTAY